VRFESGPAILLLLALPSAAAQFMSESTAIFPSDPENAVWFGNAIARDGDVLVVGSPYANPGGAAYVFARQGAAWVQEAKLLPLEGTSNDQFGGAVAVDGATILVGARLFGTPPVAPGLVFVFVRDGAGWVEQAQLRPADPEHGDSFGDSVGLSGDTAVVGVPFADSPAGAASGRVDVFRRVGAAWYLEAQLTSDPPVALDHFASAVAIDGDTLLVGGHTLPTGSVHVFRRVGTTWTLETVLSPDAGSAAESFGFSVDLDEDVALVGDPGYGGFFGQVGGAAFVFRRTGQTWIQEALLTASNAGSKLNLGYSVSVEGERALVGSPSGTDGAQHGGAYLFEHAGGAWEQTVVLSPPGDDAAGFAVQLQADSALIGVPYDDTYFDGSGAVLDFALTAQPWSIVGTGIAGSVGVPGLFGIGVPVPGADVALAINNGLPSTPLTLVIGDALLAAPLLDGTLYPQPDVLLGGLLTSAAGAASLSGPWPAGIPPGSTLVFQVWLPDVSVPLGWTASAGIQLLVP
jgi:FG-GAP repeat